MPDKYHSHWRPVLRYCRDRRIAGEYGAATGGLFLAFPAIFCASATLVETHERKRKHKAGLHGECRGREAAALESTGAALGSVGLLIFAAIVWRVLAWVGTAWALTGATGAWLLVSVTMWWVRRFFCRRTR
jgi:hypothetical protein